MKLVRLISLFGLFNTAVNDKISIDWIHSIVPTLWVTLKDFKNVVTQIYVEVLSDICINI